MEPAKAFPYLIRTVSYNNSDWAALYHNLSKTRKWWEMAEKVVRKTEAEVRVQRMIYKEIVQSVLLYGRDIWVVMRAMLKVLEGLYHRTARRVAEMTERRTTSGEWEWPPVDNSLDTVGILPIKEYIQRRQSTIAAQVACQPLYEICTGT